MPIYAVTGASGHLGRFAVKDLLTRAVPAANVVAVVRTPSKAADLAARGVQVRAADYSQPETLPAALAGVDRLLLVSSSEAGQRVAHHTNVIEAAKAAGVSRIAYTSMLKADDSTNPLAAEHQETEQVLVSSTPSNTSPTAATGGNLSAGSPQQRPRCSPSAGFGLNRKGVHPLAAATAK